MSSTEAPRSLALLRAGVRGRVVCIDRANASRADRLAALGVTPGASVTVLQTFPGVVFLCDRTEVAVESAVASSILVEVSDENPDLRATS
jgi:Fe2+ transport system protein FeoA